jgi:hypothetical protein
MLRRFVVVAICARCTTRQVLALKVLAGVRMRKYEFEVIIKSFEDVSAALVLIQNALIAINHRVTKLENE